MNETEIAAQIASGALPSPQRCAGFWLTALRITGTGTAFRNTLNEHVYRPPENYLTSEFLARCNGLPIIANHPDGPLTGEEYEARVLGAICLPYIAKGDGVADEAGDEVWGVGRLYSDEVVRAMAADPLSTSPAVVFRPADGNTKVQLDDGSMLLIEGTPSLLCHVCVTDAGVWDKGGPPTGVRYDSEKGKTMTEEEKKAAEAAAADKARCDAEEKENARECRDAELSSNIDKVLSHLHDVAKRLGVLEAASKPTNPPSRTWQMPSAQDEKEQREEYAKMADAQARADGVYLAHGLRSPAPHAYETLPAYRVRLARGLQPHCKTFAKADIGALVADAAAFDAVEGVIYQDALIASRTPDVPYGRMVKRVRTLESGHNVTEWFGSPTIFKSFAPPSMRVTRFNTPEQGRR